MSNAATAPVEAAQPDPRRAELARLDPADTSKILRLLRTLFAYGKNLVETLREEDDPDDLPWYAFLTRIFGTIDPALITVTIIRGLLRATALHARLSKSVGPLLPLAVREDRAARRIDGGTGRRQAAGGSVPFARRPRAAGWAFPPGWPAGEDTLDREPTPEEEMFAEIVAEDHDRPIGAILLDVCLDLGIVAALTDPATWDELVSDLTLYGGDPTTLISRSQNVQNSADPAALAAVGRCEAHSAAGTSGFRPIAGAFPPWPALPEKPVPLAEDGWGSGPGP